LARISKSIENCEKLEFLINFNMKIVDEAIIPSLKDLLLKIKDLKDDINELQGFQVKLIGEEDSLLNSLNEYQEALREKVKELYENEVSNDLMSFLMIFYKKD